MRPPDGSMGETGGMQHFLVHYGYLAIFLLAIAESACIPIPSEVTFAIAGALCSTDFVASFHETHVLNLAAVIVVGIVGSVIGSFVAYVVGRTGGRAFVDKWGKFVLLTHADLDRSEAWFQRRGALTVLLGRVIPVVRTFISFPAGMAEMNPGSFGVFTTIGVAAWVSVLSVLGYNFGGEYHKWTKGISWAGYLVVVVVVVVIAVFLWHRYQAVKAEQHGRHARRDS
jgi:membrane protein DedA with SNARE-associated domain